MISKTFVKLGESSSRVTAHLRSNEPPVSELSAALASSRGAILGIAFFTAVSNTLMLTGSFFMLQIYDRVLPSRSVPTLVGLSILAGLLFAGQGFLDLFRGRLLVRIGSSLDETLSSRIFDTIVRLPTRVGSRAEGLKPLRDIDTVRSFISGLGPTALFDLRVRQHRLRAGKLFFAYR